MTIKELEALVALPRATIRFYEQEGLLTPARGSNGYRDYTEADVKTLQKIKLLRRLGLEVEAIRRIQAGERELAPVLLEQQEKKRVQQKSVGREGEVCGRLAQMEVSYEKLAPEDWLRELEPEKEPAPQTKEEPALQHPWRRYFARMMDLCIYSLLVSAVVDGALRRQNIFLDEAWFDWLKTYLAYGLMFLLEPPMLHFWGTTPGKAVFHIQIRDYKGEKLSLSMAFWRLKELFIHGLGCGIPYFSLYQLWKNFIRCQTGEWTSWSYDPEGRVERMEVPGEAEWCWVYVMARLLLVAVSLFQTVHLLTPLRHGAPSMEQLVENYNFYTTRLEGIPIALSPDGKRAIPTQRGEKPEGLQEEYWEIVRRDGEAVGYRYVAVVCNNYISDFDFEGYFSPRRIGLLAYVGGRSTAGWLDFPSYCWIKPLPEMWQFDLIDQGVQVTQSISFPNIQPSYISPYFIEFPGTEEGTLRLEFTVQRESMRDQMKSIYGTYYDSILDVWRDGKGGVLFGD